MFTLNSADPMPPPAFLSGFEKGTADQPVGSCIVYLKDGSSPQLIPNPNNPVKPKIKEIRLLDVPDGTR